MTAEHLTELVGVVIKTTGKTQGDLANFLEVDGNTVIYWKRHGVSRRRIPRVMAKLREYIKGQV